MIAWAKNAFKAAHASTSPNRLQTELHDSMNCRLEQVDYFTEVTKSCPGKKIGSADRLYQVEWKLTPGQLQEGELTIRNVHN